MDAYRGGWLAAAAAAAWMFAVPAMAASARPAEAMSVTVERFDPTVPILRKPEPGSPRRQALDALDEAQGWRLYSLQPWFYEPGAGEPGSEVQASAATRDAEAYERSRSQWCRNEVCFHDTRVLGRVELDGSDRAAAEGALREALGRVPDYAAACIPEYRHAIGFVSGAKRYEVLLCFQCGQFTIAVDGKQLEAGQAASMGDLEALNAIFRRQGIPLARRSW